MAMLAFIIVSSLFRFGSLRQNKKPWNTNWYFTAESMSILRFVPTLALSKSGQVEGTTPSSQPAVASSLEFVVVSAILCSPQVGRGLLASSHAGTRLPIALVRPRRSPSSAAPLREMRSLPFKTKKQETTFRMPPVKNP